MKNFISIIIKGIFVVSLFSCIDEGSDTIVLPFDLNYVHQFTSNDPCLEAANLNLDAILGVDVYHYDSLITVDLDTSAASKDSRVSTSLNNERIRVAISDFCVSDEDVISLYGNDENGIFSIFSEQRITGSPLYFDIYPSCRYNYFILVAESNGSGANASASVSISGGSLSSNALLEVMMAEGKAVLFQYEVSSYNGGSEYAFDNGLVDTATSVGAPYFVGTTACGEFDCCHNSTSRLASSQKVQEYFENSNVIVNGCSRFYSSEESMKISNYVDSLSNN